MRLNIRVIRPLRNNSLHLFLRCIHAVFWLQGRHSGAFVIGKHAKYKGESHQLHQRDGRIQLSLIIRVFFKDLFEEAGSRVVLKVIVQDFPFTGAGERAFWKLRFDFSTVLNCG